MLPNLGQLAQLMKNAGKIKEGMGEMQARLSAARIDGEAGGGQVRATVDGKAEIVAIKIDPQLIAAGDTEMIEDLVVAALRDATTKSREAASREMENLTGGLNLQGMMDMLGGGGGLPGSGR